MKSKRVDTDNKSEVLNVAEVFKEEGAFVYRSVRRLSGDGAHVDDLVQDCFLTAHRVRETFDPKHGDVRAWLYGIVRNLVLRHERSLKRRFRLSKHVERNELVISSASDTPDTLIANKERARAVRRVLSALPQKQREVFSLYELEGLSGESISEMLKIAQGTVWTRLHSARKSFETSIRKMQARGELS